MVVLGIILIINSSMGMLNCIKRIDGSFFLARSHLILAVWFVYWKEKIVGSKTFILTVAESYYHPYVAELSGVLSIIIAIDVVLSRHPYPSTNIDIEVGSDCQSVLDSISHLSKILNISVYLYLVVREIKHIFSR